MTEANMELIEEEESTTSLLALPHHLIVNIFLKVMHDESYRLLVVGDLRIVLMDLGCVSKDFMSCVQSSLSMLRCVNLDSGIDHRRITGQAIPLVDDSMLEGIGRKCSKLELLRLRCSEHVTERGLLAISEGCSSTLTKLIILSCNRIGSGRFLSSLSSLRHLELKWGYALLSYHLRPILDGLVVLNLHGCELINDELFVLGSSTPNQPPPPPLPLPLLEELDLAYTLVTGATLQHLARYAPRLRRLHLGAQYFNIITSSRISEAAEATFTESRPDVAITHS